MGNQLHTCADYSQGRHEYVPWSKPILRWAGSKRKMLPLLLKIAKRTQATHYVEPFAGSACLFFALRPKNAVISDLNSELIQFYQILQIHPRILWRKANAWKSDSKTYYKIRSLDPENLPPIERAARFLYLNRYCFNGLYRANNDGKFNVPRGRNTGALPSERDLYRCSVALRSAHLIHSDFESTLKRATTKSFYYLDPPYDYTGRIERGEYGPGAFRLRDLERLQYTLECLDSAGSSYLLSYLKTTEISPLEQGRFVRKLSVRRQIASFSHHRKPIEEVLISNFDYGF